MTTFRQEALADAHRRRLEEIMRDLCGDFECEVVEFNGGDNDVHLW